jgi:hypothetical protein
MKMIKEERVIRNSGSLVRMSATGNLNRSMSKESTSPKNDQDLSPGSRHEKLKKMINLMNKHR